MTGKFKIEELQNEINSNYIIPSEQVVTVENGKVTEVEFYNQLIETPKTGDERNIMLATIIGGISMVILITVCVIKKKNK